MRLFLLVAVLFTLTYCAYGEGPSADLSALSAKFQLMISELGQKTDDYSPELDAMLQKLHNIQAPNTNRTIALEEWYGTSETSFQVAPLRIVLVVSSFEGVYLNSGIGTFYSALTDFLVSRGHHVTILYTNKDNSEEAWKKFDKWRAYNEKRDVSVVRLDPLTVHVTSPSLTQTSYQVYLYLKAHQEEFDVVHFPDWEGPGYFSLLAKHQKLAFDSKVLVVGLHGPWRWVKYANQDPALTQERDVETDWLEQKSVELADMLVTPSRDLPQWLAGQGWALPDSENIFLMPFLAGKEVMMLNQRDRKINPKPKVNELVFFGRLEARKGLKEFVDALDILALRLEPEFKTLKITFMGRNANIDGQSAQDYITTRSKSGQWGFTLHFITYKDRRHSLEYLMGSGRLAVMPSLVDNAPYTVYECLYMRVPFVASDLPSISTLIHTEDRQKVLFSPNADAIAKMLSDNVMSGAVVARSSLQPNTASMSWDSFYHQVNVKHNQHHATIPAVSVPKISICIPFYNRHHLLPMTLQSIKDQQYPTDSIEVVLVDDGSTNQSAIDYVDSLKPEFDANGWHIVRTENRYLGAARNTAARVARGDYILFLDDDNLAAPTSLVTYTAVARATSADVLTAAHDVFRGVNLPDESLEGANIMSRSIPLGAAVAVGVFKNCFGDANFFVRREAFLELGGFTEERGVGHEEYEFLAKAALSGLKLEAIPEPLLFYRMHDRADQMMFNTNPVENQVRSARPYASILGEDDTEAGDLLKVLAHKRAVAMTERDVAQCNMTVSNVSPSLIKANTITRLTFTARTMDCSISAVYIGSFRCTNLVVTPPSSFQCDTVAIPFSGRYVVSIQYVETSDVVHSTGTRVIVEANQIVYDTAVILGKFIADPSKFSIPALYTKFYDLIDAKGVTFSTIEDIVRSLTKRATTATVQHDLKFSVQTAQNSSATAVAAQLVTAVSSNKAAFTSLGVSWTSFDPVGGCVVGGSCFCTPNWAGVDCSQKSDCLNNCTGNGDCADGLFGRVCNCFKGQVGQDCGYEACTLDCSGHGTCLLKSGQDSTCQCDLGWNGDGCDTASNCPNGCSGFGTCNQGVCLCVTGRSGTDCSTFADSIRGEETEPLAGSEKSTDFGTIGLAVAVAVVGTLFIAIGVLAALLHRERKR